MKKIKPGLVLELVANLLLPWLAYRLALSHWGEVGALYASAAPPLVWSLAEFVRTRRVDALSALVLFGIVLSIVTFALGGSPGILLGARIARGGRDWHRVSRLDAVQAPAHLLSRACDCRARSRKTARRVSNRTGATARCRVRRCV